MFNRFQEFVESNKLFRKNDKLLIGVSGGIDSVVLLQLIDQLKMDYAIAHCNFQLRGSESDADEAFVSGLANHYKVPIFKISFDTTNIAREEGQSVEMTARELRYQWFEEIRQKSKYNSVVVGHHQDDVLETFILNLSRGTGIRGLSGIKPVSGNVVRPLLFATREEIEQYATKRSLIYRTDSTNRDQSIPRNKVRLSILPMLEELNPSFRKTMLRSIANLYDTEKIFLQRIESVRQEVTSFSSHSTMLSIKKLKELDPIGTYLYELLSPFNFNSDQVADLTKAINGQPGTQFVSKTHRLIVDREYLIISSTNLAVPKVLRGRPLKAAIGNDRIPFSTTQATSGKVTQNAPGKKEILNQDNAIGEVVMLEKMPATIDAPIKLKVSVERYSSDYQIPESPNVAVFDYYKLAGNLMLRKWLPGDAFTPLGMKGFKKLSDFFIDEKFSIPQKENTWLLCSGSQIAWVIGSRIDDRFKVNPITRMVLRIDFTPDE